MAISSIGGGGFSQRGLGTSGLDGGAFGANGGASTPQSSSQGLEQDQGTTADAAGLSAEAQESSGAASDPGGDRSQMLTEKLKQDLEAVAQAQQGGGGDSGIAVSQLKETYEKGKSLGEIDQVDSTVKDQAEQVLGIQGGGGDATSTEPGSSGSGSGSGSGSAEASYDKGVKSGLDALLGAG